MNLKRKYLGHILNTINEQLSSSDIVIVDGLYIDDVVRVLKENYNCKMMYLETDNNIRYERISKRLSITIEQAKKENEIKERLKDEVGIDRLIESADYVIDGNKSINEVFEDVKQFIEQ